MHCCIGGLLFFHVVILLLLLFLWPLGHVCVLEEASLLCRLPEEEFFSGSKDNKLINQAKMQKKFSCCSFSNVRICCNVLMVNWILIFGVLVEQNNWDYFLTFYRPNMKYIGRLIENSCSHILSSLTNYDFEPYELWIDFLLALTQRGRARTYCALRSLR